MEKSEKSFQARRSEPIQDNTVSMDAVSVPQEDVIDLQELFWALVDKWKVIFLMMLIGAVLMGLYHTFLKQPSYQADASIFITSNESVISFTDLQLSSEAGYQRSGSESELQTAVQSCGCKQSAGFTYYQYFCYVRGYRTVQGHCQFTDEYWN